jgi:hypothetical protein
VPLAQSAEKRGKFTTANHSFHPARLQQSTQCEGREHEPLRGPLVIVRAHRLPLVSPASPASPASPIDHVMVVMGRRWACERTCQIPGRCFPSRPCGSLPPGPTSEPSAVSTNLDNAAVFGEKPVLCQSPGLAHGAGWGGTDGAERGRAASWVSGAVGVMGGSGAPGSVACSAGHSRPELGSTNVVASL